MSHSRLSVATLVIFVLVAAAVVLFGALGVIEFRAERNRQLQVLHNELSAHADRIATALSLPVWNFDHPQIDKVIESIMNDEDIYGVVVTLADKHATVIVRARDANWHIESLDKPFSAEGLFEERRDITAPEEVLGSVRVFATPKFVEAGFQQTLITTITTVLVVGTVLVLSLYLLLWRIVLHPLREIERFAVAVSSGDKTDFKIPDVRYQGELEGLRISIGKMLDELAGRYSALLRSEEQFRQLIKHSPVPIAISNQAGDIEYVNDRFVDVFGYTRDEIPTLADWWRRAYPQEDYRRSVMAAWENAIAKARESGGDIEARENRVTCKDGTQRIADTFSAKIGEKNLVILNDVTTRKQAEEVLLRSREELEQLVNERTAELVSANQRLQELDRLKSQFLATMSHELRTPLNSIIGFTGILRKGMAGAVNDEQKKQLGMVYNSAQHLLALISDLLDLSRIEAGKMELFNQEFEFAEVANEVVETLKPMAEQKGLTMESKWDMGALKITGDRKRCFQILLNLANNALKFTNEGGIEITGRADHEKLHICVSDSGIGIKPEQQAQLFEAFRQVDGTAKRVYEGTGLGLYLCRRFLTLMGGEISVSSVYGKGSKFTFSIPLQPLKDPHPAIAKDRP